MASESKTKWAYLAGLLDGDGSILIRRRDKNKTNGDRQRGISFVVVIKISGEPQHLGLLRDELDIGNLYIRKRLGQRHLAEWTIAGGQAISLLTNILPFLRLKREQAEVALSMPSPKSRWGVTTELRINQEDCRLKVTHLNQLGRGKKEVSHGS